MSQVSKYRLSEKLKDEIESLLVEVFSEINRPDQVDDFLKDFFSPTERVVFSKRIAIALMLKKKYSYDEIKDVLKVSQPTIAMVSSKLKYSGENYNLIMEKFISRQKVVKFLDKMESLVLKGLTIGRGKGTGFWRGVDRSRKKKSSII